MMKPDVKVETKPGHNRLAQLLVLLLQAALNVQQMIHFLLQLFLGGP